MSFLVKLSPLNSFFIGLNHPWAFALNVLGLVFLGLMSMVFVIITRSILEVFGPVISDTTTLWSASQTAEGIARLKSCRSFVRRIDLGFQMPAAARALRRVWTQLSE